MPNDYLQSITKFLECIKPLEPIATNLQPILEPALPIKALIFDIYGTLIISASGDLEQASISIDNLTKALRVSGYDWISSNYKDHAELMLELFHTKVREHQQCLKEKGHPYPEVDIIKVWAECFDTALKNKWLMVVDKTNSKLHTVIFEILSNAVWPMPGMNALIEQLKTKNIPLGIVSNAQFYTPIIMNYFMQNKVVEDEFLHGFAENVSVFSYKLLRSKPDTFLFKELAKSLEKNYSLKPEEVLFVGNDMLKDVWTASQVGFKTALFAADKRSLRMRENDDRCQGLTPDFVVTELSQILSLI